MSQAPRRTRRASPRRRAFMTGRIVFGAGQNRKRVLCFVRDINSEGAQLELCDSTVPPQRFELELRTEETLHHARQVWREGRHVGVSFREGGNLATLAVDSDAWIA